MVAAAVLALGAEARSAKATQPLREPLPLDVVTSIRAHNGRSPIQLSPDGEWVAHTFGRAEAVPRLTALFSATGVPFAEGNARMQAALTNTRTGEMVRLGGDKGSSWGAVWSPDGQRVAFYSDDSGEVSLWIWGKRTRKAERFPGVVARPFFGFELARWSADGRVLCKILPAGMTVAEAIALVPDGAAGRRFPPADQAKPSVLVLRANMESAKPAQDPPRRTSGSDRELADLAILDVAARRIVRRVERTRSTWYAWSPDGSRIAYTEHIGWEPNTQQTNYDLVILDPATGSRRVVLKGFRSTYGIDLSWAPDGKRIAHIASGPLGKGQLHIVSLTGDPAQVVTATGVPSFDTSDGERVPLWSGDGRRIYAAGSDGNVWSIDSVTGQGTVAGELAGHQLRLLVSKTHTFAPWSTDRERTLWVLGRDRETQQPGFYQIDVAARTVRRAFGEPKVYSTSFNIDASDATGAIVFAARDQRQPAELWQFHTKQGSARQVTRLNEELQKYELGVTRLIEWTTRDGQKLRGALRLPPGYEAGRRLPLVVWIYGGDNGSSNINTFGLTGHGSTFNMQVLATRGYAVLFPDAPVEQGRIAADLMSAVMPGVDAAIAQGYADPDRLAIMGQSFGALNVLSIITSTPRFKAAVITASVIHPDLFSAYTEMSPDGSAASAGYYEQGQGNMGGTPWQYPDRYRENSPLFAFDRITTPLLIGQGEKDGNLRGPEAVFVALQRLGKKVEYLLYENEGHVINRKANIIDFWNRRLEFLAEHVKIERGSR